MKMATKKDLYMYVQSPEVLCRLNVTKLCKGGADLELVCDFRNCTSTSGGSPTGMGCMVVDSKLYMVGGANVVIDENDGSCKENFCLDAFAFDPTTDPTKEGLLVPVRDIPRLSGYKPRPIMVTLEGKIYLLSRHSYYSYLFELDLEAPHFEVFDPNPNPNPNPVDGGDRKWEILPNPLSFGKSGGDTILDYFAWGHRLGIYTQAGFCMFDASKNKWEDGTEFSSQFCVLDDLSFVPHPVLELNLRAFALPCQEMGISSLLMTFRTPMVSSSLIGYYVSFLLCSILDSSFTWALSPISVMAVCVSCMVARRRSSSQAGGLLFV